MACMEFVDCDVHAGHCFSEQAYSDQSLPPPNRFKKDKALHVVTDPEKLRLIRAYKQVHRKEAVEFELSSSPSSSPKLNPEEWLSVFKTTSSVLND